MSKVTLSHVYIVRGVVSAWVEASGSKVHKVGHMPYEGWFCTCKRGKRCTQIAAVKALVPVQAVEAGARGVEAGHVKGGVCVPLERTPVHV